MASATRLGAENHNTFYWFFILIIGSRTDLKEVSDNELNFIEDSINPGVVTGLLYLAAVNIYSNHSVAGLGKLDGIATDTTESIHYEAAGHDLGDVLSNLLRGDGVPGLLIHQDALVVLGEQPVSLHPIFVDTRRVVGVSLGGRSYVCFEVDIDI